ncbi:NACHT, LRR and PYD domains-containing protein 14 [Gonapodya sp. JEL0774]|nr:NACHT, LRR and PYD domains-containing protein 14 [Gonapodya sp. JEL0774]
MSATGVDEVLNRIKAEPEPASIPELNSWVRDIFAGKIIPALAAIVPFPGVSEVWNLGLMIYDAALSVSQNKAAAYSLAMRVGKLIIAMNEKALSSTYVQSRDIMKADPKVHADEQTKMISELRAMFGQLRRASKKERQKVLFDRFEKFSGPVLPKLPDLNLQILCRDFMKKLLAILDFLDEERKKSWTMQLMGSKNCRNAISGFHSSLDDDMKTLTLALVKSTAEMVATDVKQGLASIQEALAYTKEQLDADIKDDLEQIRADTEEIKGNIGEMLKLQLSTMDKLDTNHRETMKTMETNYKQMLLGLEEYHKEVRGQLDLPADVRLPEAIQRMRFEEFPDLKKWTFTSADFRVACQALRRFATVNILELEGKGINDESIQFLVDALEKNKSWSLKQLYFADNRIGAVGARYLANAIKLPKEFPITVLRLSYNTEIGDEGTNYIAEALEDYNCGLQNLSLAACNVSDISLKALSNALRKNETVRFLSLYDNPLISDEGTLELAEAIKVNSRLESLNLRSVDMSFQAVMKLAEAFVEDEELVKVDLQYNVLEEEQMLQVKQYFESATFNNSREKKYFWIAYSKITIDKYNRTKMSPPMNVNLWDIKYAAADKADTQRSHAESAASAAEEKSAS